MRLIDADALIAYIKKRIRNEMVIAWLCRIISEVPTIEVEPVRHGRWVKDGDFLICLECESEINIKNSLGIENKKNYCPNCGAKMDGDLK